MQCPICFHENILIKYNNSLYDDRYAYPGKFSLFVCANCRHGWIDANFIAEEIQNLYTRYYPRSTYDASCYKPAEPVSGFGAWLKPDDSFAYSHVPQNVRVLDIGCGYCETLGYHQARGCDAYGVEADGNVAAVAEKYGFKVHIGLFDHSIYEAGFFDYITMDQLIEHASDPLEMLKGAARILKKGGRLIISTPNINGFFAKLFAKRWLHWHVPYHLNFFSKQSISILADKAALSLECTKSATNPEWLTHQQIHLMARPSEGEKAMFWDPHTKRGIFDKIKFKLIPQLFHKTCINLLITRITDYFGCGDNYVFILKKDREN